LILLFLACQDEGRQSMLLPVQAAADPAAPYQLADGTTLELTTATVRFSNILWEMPAQASFFPSLIPMAMAHPGHDFAGDVAGELTGAWTLDLLGESSILGDATIYEGDFADARLTLPDAETATFRGTATLPDSTTRDFDFVVNKAHDLTGIPYVDTLFASSPPSGLALGVNLPHMLSFVDWTTPDSDGDGLLTTADGDLANTVTFGVTATPSWSMQTLR
jgi:hypothetical protein